MYELKSQRLVVGRPKEKKLHRDGIKIRPP